MLGTEESSGIKGSGSKSTSAMPLFTDADEADIRRMCFFEFGKAVAKEGKHLDVGNAALSEQFAKEVARLRCRVSKRLHEMFDEKYWPNVDPIRWINYDEMELIEPSTETKVVSGKNPNEGK